MVCRGQLGGGNGQTILYCDPKTLEEIGSLQKNIYMYVYIHIFHKPINVHFFVFVALCSAMYS